MRIHQLPLDEGPLWEHLQAGEFEEARAIVDDYYSRSNPDGFDDPNGITKAENLIPTENCPELLESTFKIRKSKKTNLSLIYIVGAVFALFGFLSYKVGNFYPMIIPAILTPAAIPPIYNLFDKSSQITLTKDHIEFKKSKKDPIKWDNILSIYYYYRERQTGFVGDQDAEFIHIYRKNAVKAEVFYLKFLEYKPTDIVHLISEYQKKKEI